MKKIYFYSVVLLFTVLGSINGTAQNFELLSKSPSENSSAIDNNANIVLIFNQAVDAATVTSSTILIRGRLTGIIPGSFTTNGNVVTFDPTNSFKSGERIRITITENVQSTSAQSFNGGFSYSFRARSTSNTDVSLWVEHNILSGNDNQGADGVTVADIDNDGDIDVFVTIRERHRAEWYENDGSGNFTKHTVDSAVGAPTAPYAADFDNDGDIDFLVSGNADRVLVYMNGLVEGDVDPTDGFPNFTRTSIFSFGFPVEDAIHGDFDNDGDEDLIFSPLDVPTIYLLKNDGTGTFNSIALFSDNTFLDILKAYDMNHDGFLDVILSGGIGLEIWLNNKDFTFTNQGNILDEDTTTQTVDFGDLNSDGNIDLVVTLEDAGKVVTLINDGNLNFTEQTIETNVLSALPVRLADFDGDLDLDVLYSGDQTDGGYLKLNDGAFGFDFASGTDGNINSFPITSFKEADLDGDGYLDIITSSWSASQVNWYKGVQNIASLSVSQQGDETTDIELTVTLNSNALANVTFDVSSAGGTATEATDYESLTGKQITVNAGSNTASIIIDVTDDGLNETTESVIFSLSNSTINSVGIANNGLAEATIIDSSSLSITSTSPSDYAIGALATSNISVNFDVNTNASTITSDHFKVISDKRGILAGSFSGGGTQTVTFTPSSTFLPGEVITVYLKDIEGTGGELMKNPYHFSFNIAAANSSIGHLNLQTSVDSSSDPRGVHSADLDNDNDLDLIASFNDGTIKYYLNDGSGNFGAGVQINTGNTNFAGTIQTFDQDNDGDLDIVVGYLIARNVQIYNNDALSFTVQNIAINQDSSADKITPYDFNNDGFLDLLIEGERINRQELKVTLLENVSGTSFTEHVLLGQNSRAADLLDMNGDHIKDIIYDPDGRLAALTNDGDITFTNEVYFDGTYTSSVSSVADLDGDGDPDILSYDTNLDELFWYQNLGNNNWQTNSIATGFNNHYIDESKDYDGDGDIDFSIRSLDGDDFRIYTNDGSGNFTEVIKIATGNPYEISTGDFDGDGKIDYAVVEDSDNNINLYTSIIAEASLSVTQHGAEDGGSGISVPVEFTVTLTHPNTSGSDLVFDLTDTANGNATSGVDYTALSGTQITVLNGQSTGSVTVDVTFEASPVVEGTETLETSISFAAATDNFTISNATATANIMDASSFSLVSMTPSINQGNVAANGSFVLTFDQSINDTGNNITNNIMLFGEVSGYKTFTVSGSGTSTITLDPSSDFFAGETVCLSSTKNIVSESGATISQPLNSLFQVAADPFTIGNAFTTETIETNDYANDTEFADVTGDGLPDLIFASQGGIGFYTNDGTGGFTSKTTIRTAIYLDSYPVDLDLDGDIDIVAGGFQDRVYWFENNGDGTSWTDHLAFQDPDNVNFYGMTAGDLDHDGDIDIVSSASTGDEISWYENDGTNNGWTQHFITNIDLISESDLGDIDGDGDLDIVANGRNSDAIHIFQNDGSGTFTETTISNTSEPMSVNLSDLDQDGDLDIVVGANLYENFYWYENTGGLNFTEHLLLTISFGYDAHETEIIDFNGDGSLDIVFGGGNSTDTNSGLNNGLYWLQNDGSQNFTFNTVDVGVSDIRSVDVTDIDGNGSLDVVYGTDGDSDATEMITIHRPVSNANVSITQNGTEGTQDITVTVTLDNPNKTGGNLTFDITDSGTGTATSGDDYTAISGQITVPNGQSTGTFTIVVSDDPDVEEEETIDISISNSSSNLFAINTATAQATITSNDQLTAALSVTTQGDENGPVNAIFTVTLSEASSSDITFNIDDLLSGTANAGEDYTALDENATIVVNSGNTTGTYSLAVLTDSFIEDTETVALQISSSNEDVNITTSDATANISNDGGSSVDASLLVTTNGAEGGSDIVVTVQLSGNNPSATSQPIVFDISDLSSTLGTATSGDDYTMSSTTISIPVGQDSGSLTITVNEDTDAEDLETLFLNLSINDAADVTVEIDVFSAEPTITDNDELMWDGSSNNDWNNPSNWSSGKVPSLTTDVMIPAGSVVTASSGILAKNIMLEDGANLTVTNNISTNGSVTLSNGASLISKNSIPFNHTYTRDLATTNWYIVSSTTANETIEDLIADHNLATGSANPSNLGLGMYDNNVPGWVYQQVGATGSIAPGKGVAILLASAGQLSFSGNTQVDDVTVAISEGSGNGFNLLGNPYPSYIPANNNADATNNILTVNGSLLNEVTLWLWDQSINNYTVVTNAQSARFIAPGQGFLVESNSQGGNFSFTQDMQNHNGSDSFSRQTNTNPTIILTITEEDAIAKTEVYYIDGMTKGWDASYDGTLFGGNGNTSGLKLYTELVNNSQGQKLGVQALPNTDFEITVVPLGVHAADGSTITFSLDASDFPVGVEVYLEDKESNAFVKLSEANSQYTVTLDSDPNGIGRFYLHTKSNVLSNDEVVVDENVISMYTTDPKNLRIVGVDSGKADLEIYNILGQLSFETSFEGNNVNDITIPSLKAGVYIINLQTEKSKVNKKIIIE